MPKTPTMSVCRLQPAKSLPRPDGWAVRRRRAIRQTIGVRSAGIQLSDRIDALVLDIGGVVIPTLFESVNLDNFPKGPMINEAAYRSVEIGELSERSYWASLAERHPDLDIGDLWRRCSSVRAEIQHLLLAVSGRVKIVALTNDMKHWFGEQWQLRFPELEAFDHVFEADVMGGTKPDPEVFHNVAAAIGLDPHRCLVVDDLAVNLDGAAIAGMQVQPFDVTDPARSVLAVLSRLRLGSASRGRRIFYSPKIRQ